MQQQWIQLFESSNIDILEKRSIVSFIVPLHINITGPFNTVSSIWGGNTTGVLCGYYRSTLGFAVSRERKRAAFYAILLDGKRLRFGIQ